MSTAAAPLPTQQQAPVDPKAVIKRCVYRLAKESFEEERKLFNVGIEARGDNIGTRTYRDKLENSEFKLREDVERYMLQASLLLEKAGETEARRQVVVGVLADSKEALMGNKKEKEDALQAKMTMEQKHANDRAEYAAKFKTKKRKVLKQLAFVDLEDVSDMKNTLDVKHGESASHAPASTAAASSSAPAAPAVQRTEPVSSPVMHSSVAPVSSQPPQPSPVPVPQPSPAKTFQQHGVYPSEHNRHRLRFHGSDPMDCSSSTAEVAQAEFGVQTFGVIASTPA